MEKILFISLQDDLDAVSLKFLHYHLLQNGYNSFILYLQNFRVQNKHQLGAIKNFILKLKPTLTGVSLMSINYEKAVSLTKYLKLFCKTKIIWGGIHPTISPESCLEYADYVCIGEGEKVILKIAEASRKGEDIHNINNLAYRDNDGIKRNPLFPLIQSSEIPTFEQIPKSSFVLEDNKISPLDRKLFIKYDRYLGRLYNVAVTRGCPFSCSYCCNEFISNLYNFNRIRRRNIMNVINDLQSAIRSNPSIVNINFYDDCLLACNEQELARFFKVYQEKIAKPFTVKSIPLYLTEGKMRILKEAGLAWFNMGLQSGSDRVCKEIYNRESLRADFLKAANITKYFKVAPVYDVILDNPFESTEDKLQTLETLAKTPKPFYADFFSLTFFYGTELYKRVKSEPAYQFDISFSKDYKLLKKTEINNLIKLSVFIKEKYMNKITAIYRCCPDSLKFKLYLWIANLLTFFIFQPLTYYQTIRISQQGSNWKALKILPVYFRVGIRTYLKQL